LLPGKVWALPNRSSIPPPATISSYQVGRRFLSFLLFSRPYASPDLSSVVLLVEVVKAQEGRGSLTSGHHLSQFDLSLMATGLLCFHCFCAGNPKWGALQRFLTLPRARSPISETRVSPGLPSPPIFFFSFFFETLPLLSSFRKQEVLFSPGTTLESFRRSKHSSSRPSGDRSFPFLHLPDRQPDPFRAGSSRCNKLCRPFARTLASNDSRKGGISISSVSSGLRGSCLEYGSEVSPRSRERSYRIPLSRWGPFSQSAPARKDALPDRHVLPSAFSLAFPSCCTT